MNLKLIILFLILLPACKVVKDSCDRTYGEVVKVEHVTEADKRYKKLEVYYWDFEETAEGTFRREKFHIIYKNPDSRWKLGDSYLIRVCR